MNGPAGYIAPSGPHWVKNARKGMAWEREQRRAERAAARGYYP